VGLTFDENSGVDRANVGVVVYRPVQGIHVEMVVLFVASGRWAAADDVQRNGAGAKRRGW
jgi:hypothetical protein